ncbi:MAG TPA: hypothetical protein VFA56_11965 [Gaiellaceae bacterium]|nr:hypothetical protein [Gaiellaceae bacterium]
MRLVVLLAAFLACASSAFAAAREPTPTAAEFGYDFVATANAYAAAHGKRERLVKPDCVQAAPGKYMCAYAVHRPGAKPECRLMQATWTPHAESTYTVTLSGRVARCRSLRDALDSL